jgi:Zn-dependent M16 (insulinase) family peptidase
MTITHGFELIEERDIPELNTRARLYRHIKSGAQLLSMMNDDENKVFGISFATPPEDSTGIAHIMEHSVLCGSRKYPLKEPFVELIKGSLKTFVNAMTFPDKTIYPVASQNTKDLYNLTDVYLDSVFYPNITPWTLMQEGWHYELESKDQPLQYKGVVFNEMKGNYSSPESMLGEYTSQTLFPDTVYGLDSGGDPAAIPDLDYEQFRTFHDTYYHPSNAQIVMYGDDDPDERLRYLNSWLKDFDAIKVEPKMPLQPRFAEPRREVRYYGAGEDADSRKAYVKVSWLLTDESDPETAMALDILSHMLAGTPASPLRKALIDSGLGEDIVGGYVDNNIRESFYTIGLKGVDPADVDKVEALIVDTLKHLSEHGFDYDQVEASLNTIEFNLREANFGGYPRGIVYMITALQTWLYGKDPFDSLHFEKPLKSIKTRLSNHEYVFANLIKQYLTDNPHRVTLVMLPSATWQSERDEAERARLDAARARMSDADLDQIIEETRKLKEMQVAPDSPEALATIPSLKLADLDKKSKTIPIEVSEDGGATTLYHDIATNGIAYLDIGFDLRVLPAADVPYVGLLGNVLLEMGTETEDFVSLSRRIGRKTGGIRSSAMNTVTRNDRTPISCFFLRGKSTVAQFDDLLDILRDVLTTAKLDNKERFKQIVLEEKAGMEGGLVPSGHSYASSRLRSSFSATDWASEQMGGVSYLFFVRKLAERVENDWAGVLEDLQRVRDMLVNRNGLIVNITIDAANWQTLQPKLATFINQLPTSNARLSDWPEGGNNQNEGLTIPAQVNYVAKGADVYALGHKMHGSWLAIHNWLRTTYLWERIRVQGGAYGGFCTFDPLGGAFTYLSYRDPNLVGTVNNYDGTPEFIRTHAPDEAEVERTIIGVIGGLDTYMLPDAKGWTSMSRYLTHTTDEQRQQTRDEVLGTTPADFAKFASVVDDVAAHGRVVVVGSPQAIEKANAERGGDWLNVTKVL